MPKNTQIIADEDVDLGGCRIETATETIDGDISTQFDEIQRKLLNKWKQNLSLKNTLKH